MKAAFYISCHGLGHATRQLAVMTALRRLYPSVKLTIRAPTPEALFRDELGGGYDYSPTAIDSGVAELDIFDQDVERTMSECASLMRRATAIADDEARWIMAAGVDVIVSDVPALASEIGKLTGVPVVAIGNFSWDFIYESYARSRAGYGWIVDQTREAYAATSVFLRLPFGHSVSAFPAWRDIPLIVRGTVTESSVTRARLGLPIGGETKVVLIALRHDLDVGHAIDDLLTDPRIHVIRAGGKPAAPRERVVVLEGDRTIRFVDVLGACDAVVSKLGYGMAAECVATRTPLVFPPRLNYPEHDLLVASTSHVLSSRQISRSDFVRGTWRSAVSDALDAQFAWPDVDLSGAEAAAREILKWGGIELPTH